MLVNKNDHSAWPQGADGLAEESDKNTQDYKAGFLKSAQGAVGVEKKPLNTASWAEFQEVSSRGSDAWTESSREAGVRPQKMLDTVSRHRNSMWEAQRLDWGQHVWGSARNWSMGSVRYIWRSRSRVDHVGLCISCSVLQAVSILRRRVTWFVFWEEVFWCEVVGDWSWKGLKAERLLGAPRVAWLGDHGSPA